MDAIFKNLDEHCLWVKTLGCYSTSLKRVTTDRISWSDLVDGGVIAC